MLKFIHSGHSFLLQIDYLGLLSVKALIFEKMEGKYTKKRMGAGTKMDIGVTHTIECTLNVDPTVQAEDSDEAEA